MTVDLSVRGRAPTDGDDVILATTGPDRIYADADVISTLDGRDEIFGEGGSDLVFRLPARPIVLGPNTIPVTMRMSTGGDLGGPG